MGPAPKDLERGERDSVASRASRHCSTGKSIADLAVGMTASLSRTYDEWDILTFAAVTGDLNPVHVDETFAQESVFEGKVAHGLLTASLVSAVLGTVLPGPGAIYLSQELKFRRPVRIGDAINATVEVTELIPTKSLVRLKTTCTNQRDQVVLEGTALVRPPRPK